MAIQKYTFIVFITTLITSFGYANNTAKSISNNGQNTQLNMRAQVVETKKVDFLMKRDLPKNLCANKGDILRCHRIKKNECHVLVKKNISKCISEIKITKKVSAIGAVRYGESVGLCVSKKNSRQLRTKKMRKCHE